MSIFCYGASGHGKVVADILRLGGEQLLGFVDDDASKACTCLAGFPVMGTASKLPELVSQGAAAVITIGSNPTRTAKARELEQLGFRFATAVHPSAIVARDVVIGPGTVVMAGAVINSGSIIGSHVIINTGATIDHDCVLEEGVHISPGASLAGGIVVGANAHVGVRASVIQKIQIGCESMVGAGAVVIRDVLPRTTVVGSPARPLTTKDHLSPAKQKVLVAPAQSIRETLKAIDESGLAIALVVDETRRLLGTVTDGDVRRALLRGVGMESPVSAIMNRVPATVSPAQSLEEIREFMMTSTLKHAVVADHDRRVTDLITMAEVLSVPMSASDITDREVRAVTRLLTCPAPTRSSLSDFEQQVAARAGRRYAVAVNSGRAALSVLVRALGLGRGDEIIASGLGFGDEGEWLFREDLTPRFVDIDHRTCHLDPEKIEDAITPQSKAILAVDALGQPADYDRLQETASRRGLFLILDAGQSIGAEYQHRPAASYGTAAVFGFQSGSPVTTGEGGAIVTDDLELEDRCRTLAYKHRLADLNCALGLAQLERLDEVLESRRQLAELYDHLLEAYDFVRRPWVSPQTTRMSWFTYTVQLSDEFDRSDRDRIVESLRQEGIEANCSFSFLASDPRSWARGPRTGPLPIAQAVADRSLALPFHPHLKPRDMEWVAKKLSSAVEAHSHRRHHAKTQGFPAIAQP